MSKIYNECVRSIFEIEPPYENFASTHDFFASTHDILRHKISWVEAEISWVEAKKTWVEAKFSYGGSILKIGLMHSLKIFDKNENHHRIHNFFWDILDITCYIVGLPL